MDEEAGDPSGSRRPFTLILVDLTEFVLAPPKVPSLNATEHIWAISGRRFAYLLVIFAVQALLCHRPIRGMSPWLPGGAILAKAHPRHILSDTLGIRPLDHGFTIFLNP